MSGDHLEALERLWALKQSGALSESEFESAKARLLAAPKAATPGSALADMPESSPAQEPGAPAAQPSPNLPAPEQSNRGCIIASAIFIALLVLGGIIGGGEAPRATNETLGNGSAAAQPSGSAPRPRDSYTVRLRREVEDLRRSPRLAQAPTTREDVLVQTALIGARVQLYDDAPAELADDDQRLRVEFRRLQVAYQRDAFPKLRRAQAQLMDSLLWEHDVDAAAVGARNSTLRMTAGMFASNRAIGETQRTVQETAVLLRFKRTMYEWFRGSEYTYYDLTSLDDGDLAIASGNGWRRIDDN